MINIKHLWLQKHENTTDYEKIEDGIYQDLSDTEDTCFRMSLSFELEEGEDSQSPLEDVLDRFYLHISDFLDAEEEQVVALELAGDLNNIRSARTAILGKRVYNQAYTGDDGRTYIRLMIE